MEHCGCSFKHFLYQVSTILFNAPSMMSVCTCAEIEHVKLIIVKNCCWRHFLYCTILYCTVLYYIVLYYTVLYCTVLYYIVLYYTILYCIVLYCTILHSTTLYCNTSFIHIHIAVTELTEDPTDESSITNSTLSPSPSPSPTSSSSSQSLHIWQGLAFFLQNLFIFFR